MSHLFQMHLILLVVLFSACLLCCDKPCGPQEVCYPGVGCIPLEGYVKSTDTTSSIVNCFNVTIDTLLTPSLHCAGVDGKVIDTDRCHHAPLLNTANGVAQQGALLNCNGLPCDPQDGCFDSLHNAPLLIDCCGVCINPTVTPTIHCIIASNDCSPTPQIIDTNQCRSSPVIPPTNDTCVTQGEAIECAFDQTCLPDLGCVTPPTGAPTEPFLTQSDSSGDRTRLIIFFIAYAILFIVVLVITGLILFFK